MMRKERREKKKRDAIPIKLARIDPYDPTRHLLIADNGLRLRGLGTALSSHIARLLRETVRSPLSIYSLGEFALS